MFRGVEGFSQIYQYKIALVLYQVSIKYFLKPPIKLDGILLVVPKAKTKKSKTRILFFKEP